MMFERVAGLDVGKATVTAPPASACRVDVVAAGSETRQRMFKTMTGSLQVMRDWLLENGVTIAAMESTSTYWKGSVLLPGGPHGRCGC